MPGDSWDGLVDHLPEALVPNMLGISAAICIWYSGIIYITLTFNSATILLL